MLPRIHTLAFETEETGGAGDLDLDRDAAEADTGVDDDRAGFDYEDPDFLSAVERAADARLQSTLESMASEQEGAELDGIDPDIRGLFEKIAEQKIQQALAPMVPTVEAFEEQEHERRVNEWTDKIDGIADAQQFLGEGRDARSSVQFMASGFLPDLEARYGKGERAIQGSLRLAAEQYQADIKAAHDAGYRARNEEMQGRSTARDPAPAHTEAVEIRDEPESIMAAADVWASRNNLE